MRHLKLGLMLLCILTLCACSTKRRGDPVCALPPLALMQPGEPFVPFAEGSLTDGRITNGELLDLALGLLVDKGEEEKRKARLREWRAANETLSYARRGAEE